MSQAICGGPVIKIATPEKRGAGSTRPLGVQGDVIDSCVGASESVSYSGPVSLCVPT